MLFSGETGQQYGYRDGWVEGVFEYSGEGQFGDMPMVRGNRAVRDHARNGKDLHLFETQGGGQVQYVGQMVCAGTKTREAPDLDGNMRRAIIFDLVPVESLEREEVLDKAPEVSQLWTMAMDHLLALANSGAEPSDDPRESKRRVYQRSEAVRAYVLRRARGTCEGCGAAAPFVTVDNRPYLEPHHIRRRSDGGPDDPAWVVAVCPNCHRRAHYSKDGDAYNEQLKAKIARKYEP
jgi:5-methylcytosine-specific restriction protein A